MPTRRNDLGAWMAWVETQLARLARNPRLTAASLDASAVRVFDDAGRLRAVLGVQDDGTVGAAAVNGPAPPAPTLPVVEPAVGGLVVAWDGHLDGDLAVPLDWARLEIHVGTSAEFEPEQATLWTTIESPQGGKSFLALPEGTWWIRTRARNTSGASSPAAAAVAAAPRTCPLTSITGPDWQPLHLGPGWRHPADQPPAVRRTADGDLQLTGLLLPPPGDGHRPGQTIARLPAQHRPERNQRVLVDADTPAVLQLYTDGEIHLRPASGATVPYVSLAGIRVPRNSPAGG